MRKPRASIWIVVFHLARLLTGTGTWISARYSRRPETRISRHRMTRAGSSTRPVMESTATSKRITALTRELVGDGVEEAADGGDLSAVRAR